MIASNLTLLILLALVVLYLGRKRILAAFRALDEVVAGRRLSEPDARANRAASEDMLPLEEIRAAFASVDPQRRQMLKLLALGSGAFVLGKVLGPAVSLFPGELVGDTKYFRNFRFVEKGRELTFFDSRGNEILTLESDIRS